MLSANLRRCDKGIKPYQAFVLDPSGSQCSKSFCECVLRDERSTAEHSTSMQDQSGSCGLTLYRHY